MIISMTANPEEEIVGYCLDKPEYALSKVEPEWFDDHRHGLIVATAKAMDAMGIPVNMATVFRQLHDNGEAEMAGGSPYIAHCWSQASCQGVFDYLVEQLRAEASVRVYGHLAEELRQSPEKGKELLAAVESKMPRPETDTSIDATLNKIVDKLDHHMTTPGSLLGFSSGYRFLDDVTSGMQPGQFWVIAARPGIGKTTLLLNMMLRITKRCGLISLEMTQEELVQRLWFNEANIPLSCAHVGLSREQLVEMTNARIRLAAKRFLISDSLGNMMADVAIEARSLKHKGMQVLFVDYLQLIHADTKKSDNRVAEMTMVSNSLKRLARELHMPVICACQLNREAAKAASAPELHHLRDTGAIEQDADLVVMLHPKVTDEKQLTAFVRKNRSGPTGTATLVFDKTKALIEEPV